ARGGYASFQLLLRDVPSDDVSLSVEGLPEGVQAELWSLRSVMVERNQGISGEARAPHYPERIAPYRIYDCMRPYTGRVEREGEEKTVEEVLEKVLQDRVFYEEGGGGMTLSGGEPLAQPSFSLALCEAAKKEGLHVAMETSGYCSWKTLERFLPVVDLFLYDYKAEPEQHRALTGVDSDRILSNLEHLSDAGAEIVLRCPIVPGCNDSESHYRAIAELAGRLPGIRAVNLEPYHPLGLSKAQQLGKSQPYDNPKFMEKGPLKETAAQIRELSGKPATVSGG
ncbi:MAG: glycyl-radical enzyme activating protein, partial [Clostridia bacterium]|nr:glycyl-radical enzyme activating protein [Clostridia bacterium]